MPQSAHDRAAELHNLASHAHAKAAASFGQKDRLTAHELSQKAFEHSREAHQHAQKVAHEERLAETAKP